MPVEDQLANQLFFNDRDGQSDVERIVGRLLRLGIDSEKFRLDLFLDGFDGVVAFLLLGDLLGGDDFLAVFVVNGVDELIGGLVGFAELGLADLLLQFLDRAGDFVDRRRGRP